MSTEQPLESQEGERSTVVSSIDAVFGLGDLSECSNAAALVAVAPPPSSPRQREEHDALISNPVEGSQDPTLLAESQFLFAKALAGSSSTKATLARARALADDARAAYEQSPEQWKDALEAIDSWNASLPDSAQPCPAPRERPLTLGERPTSRQCAAARS